MGWNDYSKDAEKGTGGDFPEVPDDLYEAMIQDVSEPEEEPDIYKEGETRTRFYLTWELEGPVKTNGEPVTLRQYLTLPPTYISDGFLNEKSGLYKTMEALGFDMDGRFRVAPEEWNGMEARVLVENKPNSQGDLRPRITAVKAKRAKAAAKPAARPAAAAQSAKRQPVAAGRSDDGWDDD